MNTANLQRRIASIRSTIKLLEIECCELQQELDRSATGSTPLSGDSQTAVKRAMIKRKRRIANKMNPSTHNLSII